MDKKTLRNWHIEQAGLYARRAEDRKSRAIAYGDKSNPLGVSKRKDAARYRVKQRFYLAAANFLK